MRREIGRGITFGTLMLAFLVAGPVTAEETGAGVPPEKAATGFARAFFEGRDAEVAKQVTPQVAAAMTAEQSEKIRGSLTAQNGAFGGVDEAWHEDDVQGYRRYRVPVRFEETTLDMRVVLDGDGKVAGMFFVPHVEPPASREEPEAPVREEDVEVGDPPLPGTLSVPDGPGPFPGVVLVHGSGPNDRDETLGPNKPFRDLAWGLGQRGIAVLRYDKRSLARPDDLLKVGAALTVREEVLDDARAALSFLRDRAEVDASRVFVLGHSLGGTLAPRIAAPEPRPAGVIVLAGATLPLPEKMLEQTRYIVGQAGDRSEAAANRVQQIETAVKTVRRALDGEGPEPDGPILGAPIAYYRDLEAHDPPTELAALPLPALVLQGGRDYQVTSRDFARWREALATSERACLKVYDDLDHLFRAGSGASTPDDYQRPAPVAPAVIAVIAAWIHTGGCPS